MTLGKFIVVEGIDGAGSTTQLKLITGHILGLSKDFDIYATREPTRNFRGIRERMRASTDVKQDAEWYADAFVRDRRNHVQADIQPALERGTHVVCNRYSYSTLAYQHTQGIPLERLIAMHEGLPVPDMALIYDCPAEIAFRRRQKEGAEDVFDKNLKFQEELRQNYLKLRGVLPQHNIVIIDAGNRSLDPDVSIRLVFEDTKKYIDALLKQ
jgi:dTMP kinase